MSIFKKKNRSLFDKLFRRKTKLEKFYYKNEEFIKYTLVSVICTGILYLIFYIVNLITKGNYMLANFLSYSISFTLLYILDEKVFKSRPLRKRDKALQLTCFIIIRIVGFPIDSFILHVLISKFNIENMVSKIISSLIMFIYNYITNKLFVFKKSRL